MKIVIPENLDKGLPIKYDTEKVMWRDFEIPRDLFGLHKLSDLLCSGHLVLFHQKDFSSASF